MTQHRFRAVLFDLDGTLIDSAPDIHAATVELLATDGLGPVSLDDVRGMIGDGVRNLIRRAYARFGQVLEGDALQAKVERMMPIYDRHLTALTRPIPGAFEALAALQAQGYALGLVTNKPQTTVAPILEHFGITGRFGAVVGGEAGHRPKPAPDVLQAAMRELGSDRVNTLMVGDGAADIAAARAAGIPVVALAGGYGSHPASGADVTIAHMDQLAVAILQLESDSTVAAAQ